VKEDCSINADSQSEVKEWLNRARSDLRAAKVDLAADPPLIEDALFHCQQASEKVLKGFLTFHGKPFEKTHDLDRLAQVCEGILPALAAVLKPVRPLTIFAWKFRYPGPSESPPLKEAKDALTATIKAVERIRSALPKVLGG